VRRVERVVKPAESAAVVAVEAVEPEFTEDEKAMRRATSQAMLQAGRELRDKALAAAAEKKRPVKKTNGKKG
jgi:hypothetical protein